MGNYYDLLPTENVPVPIVENRSVGIIGDGEGSMVTPPDQNIANDVVGATINTQTGEIKGSYSFTPTGSMSIGQYTPGISGAIYLSPDGIFGVNSSGTTTFSIDGITGNAVFLGYITATGGYIGGFTIESSYLFAGSGANTAGISPADYPFWAGASYSGRSTAPFNVTSDGSVSCSNITITGGSLTIGSTFSVSNAGVITATSGTIGGWTLSSTTLTSTGVILDSSGGIIVSDGANKIVLLTSSGVGYIAFYASGSLRGLMRGATAGSGGVVIVGGDMVVENNYSYLFQGTGGSNYGSLGADGSNNVLLKCTSANEFFVKSADSANSFIHVSKSGGIYINPDGSTKVEIGGNINMNGNNIDGGSSFYSHGVELKCSGTEILHIGPHSIDMAGTDKTAIVSTSEGYKALYCVESPEVWFFDFCPQGSKEDNQLIDPLFLEATEGDLKFIETTDGDYQVWRRRKGHARKRFEVKTALQFYKNEAFLRLAK